MPYCIAKFCHNSDRNNPRKARWHILPSKKKKHLRTQWLAKCGRPEPYDKQARVCSEHFVYPDDYSESMVKYSMGFLKEPVLHEDAVPSIFIDHFADDQERQPSSTGCESTPRPSTSSEPDHGATSVNRRRASYAARSKRKVG